MIVKALKRGDVLVGLNMISMRQWS